MSKVIVHVPKGPVNRKSLRRVPMYRPTYSFWFPYGMPKQRIKGHRHERKEADRWQVTWGAPRIALKEPMPTGKGVWMPIDEWWQWTDKDTRGIVNCTINKWGEDELIDPPFKPTLSKVQTDKRQYCGTDNVHWNFDAACAETIPPSECFASPEGYWQAGIWHTAEPKPVTPKLKQIEVEDAKPKLKGNMPKWDAYRVLRSAFGDKANVAFEVCNSWAFSEDGRKEAVAQVMLWAWEYTRKEFASRGKCLHDRILPAHFGAKPPEYIRECLKNALKEASRNDGTG